MKAEQRAIRVVIQTETTLSFSIPLSSLLLGEQTAGLFDYHSGRIRLGWCNVALVFLAHCYGPSCPRAVLEPPLEFPRTGKSGRPSVIWLWLVRFKGVTWCGADQCKTSLLLSTMCSVVCDQHTSVCYTFHSSCMRWLW